METKEDRTNKEILTPTQRWGGLAALGAMLLVLGFFALHQATNTGYFTEKFGILEMLALYGPILVSLAAPIVRALSGHRNPARPFDAATSFSLAMGSLWLAIIFPFNFAHLADVLPEAIRFVIAWINNDLGRFVLVLQVIIGIITTPLTMLTFFSVRRRASTT